uniref:Uncharacterized protein n=1 Tax=viral metagenome TaxID=1070528 RepID=A0A6M3IIB0_9ZZZZ
MDTSPQYIKLCEKAEEIQETKRQSGLIHGDYVYAQPNSDFTFFTGKVELFTGNPNLKYGLLGCVFIPRQDQLQEMMMVSTKYVMLYHFDLFYHNLYYDWKPTDSMFTSMEQMFTSMEQLWLAFVMKEKYGKVWSRTEWITS